MSKRTWSNQFTITEDMPLTIPAWLFKSPWEDVSWGNEICPRFINDEVGISIWVDYDQAEDRELNTVDNDGDWKKYTLVEILDTENEVLADNQLYATDDEEEMKSYIKNYASVIYRTRVQENLNALLDLYPDGEAYELVTSMLDDLASLTAMA